MGNPLVISTKLMGDCMAIYSHVFVPAATLWELNQAVPFLWAIVIQMMQCWGVKISIFHEEFHGNVAGAQGGSGHAVPPSLWFSSHLVHQSFSGPNHAANTMVVEYERLYFSCKICWGYSPSHWVTLLYSADFFWVEPSLFSHFWAVCLLWIGCIFKKSKMYLLHIGTESMDDSSLMSHMYFHTCLRYPAFVWRQQSAKKWLESVIPLLSEYFQHFLQFFEHF